jgi:hypothetical protein
MAAQQPEADTRSELERVEREIAQLREQVGELRERLAEHWDDPSDGPDRTALITMAEEQEAFLAVLEARRDELRRRLSTEGSN